MIAISIRPKGRGSRMTVMRTQVPPFLTDPKAHRPMSV